MSIADVLTGLRRNVSPDFVYDEESVKKLRAEKERESYGKGN